MKGAQIPSRRETVLVNHPAKSIATLDSSTAPIGMPSTARVLWRQSQGSMRPMGVVVVNEDAQAPGRDDESSSFPWTSGSFTASWDCTAASGR